MLKSHQNPLFEQREEPAADVTNIKQPTVHKRRRQHRRELRDCRAAETAAAAIGEIKKDEEVFGLTKEQFSLIDVVKHVLDHTGPADLTISTWTAAKAELGSVLDFTRNGSVTSMRWLVDLSFQRRAHELANEIRKTFGADSIRVAQNHAKFTMLRNADWDIVIRTSMNLNQNPRLEDFTLAHDPELAGFLGGIVDEIWHRQPARLAFDGSKAGSRWFAGF